MIEEHSERPLLAATGGDDHEQRAYEDSLFLVGERGQGRALHYPRLQDYVSGKLRHERRKGGEQGRSRLEEEEEE